ncbi:MAG: EAL domain-containing protein [Spirochaetales bacterium]|nr:EAL domain-containing protein [Spirochaetales bacterium]
MNYYAGIPFFAFLFAVVFWVYVFARKKKTRIYYSFLLFIVPFVFWNFFKFLSWLDFPENVILLFLRIKFLFILSLGYFIVNFVYAYRDRKNDIISISLAVLLPVVFIVTMASDLVVGGVKEYYWGTDEVEGTLYLPFVVIFVVLPIIYALAFFYLKGLEKRNKNEYDATVDRLLVIGGGIILTGSVFTGIVLQQLFQIVDLPETTSVFTIILALIFYRAVKKYDFLSIGPEDIAVNLFDSLLDCVIVVDNKGKLLLYNKTAEELFHIRDKGEKFDVFSILPDYRHEQDDKDREVTIIIENEPRFFLLSHSHINKAGHDSGKIIMLKDITARKKAQNALSMEKERAFITLNSIGDAVITINRDLNIMYMNRIAEHLLGFSMSEAAGIKITDILRIVSEVTREPVSNPFVTVQKRMEVVSIPDQLVLINRKGQEYHIQSSVAPIFDFDAGYSGYVIVLHDISESKNLQKQISYHASHDALTGLYNRVEFISRLDEALECEDSSIKEHVLFYIDIDNFKIINDTVGHTGGDQFLIQLSALIKHLVRQTDTIARVGEDEFAILLFNCPLDLSLTIAEKICNHVRESIFEYRERKITVTISIGVVSIKPGTGDASSFLIKADEVCKIAREKGGDRVHLFRADDLYHIKHHTELEWVSKIKNALEQSRLLLFYQPIASLSADSKGGDHFELLIRMADENGGIIAPAQFLPAAERYNFISRIDMWVIENFFKHFNKWYCKNSERRLHCCSINLSGASLNDEKMLDFIISRIREYAIPPELLCFEITETIAIVNFSETERFINTLKNMGCSFALDDFGNGLSSYNYLKRLAVDYLKIDGSFVKNIVSDEKDYAIAKTINTLGHHMGLKTIAEYVKDKQTYDLLVTIGVDFVQGYYISVPKPLVELT